MRDLIALLCHALRLVITGRTPRHRARAHPAPHTAPAPTPRSVPRHVQELRHPLTGEDVALIRPYLLAHERHREHRLQKERRTAAALASMGIDYDVTALAI
ncbi:hypothetical protein ABT390_13435 [Streptomyces aurantiacus]|uniref:Uncharacterized protein n=1 Tax=Streptomyces aurantiacus JA 4570 TaxID=1286094 RepID=S3ZCG9_9ACTN|nr:hypothetical protein [Streptomyces aurantiacus]EPH40319.1 hypothetical protein STRAU_6582 [Streptomyces aurantiacus JA 4570]